MSNERESIEFCWRLSESLWREGRFAEARRIARNILSDHHALAADIIIGTYSMLSIIERAAQNYGGAIDTLLQVRPLIGVCQDKVIAAKWHNALAHSHHKVYDYEKAIPLYGQALDLHRQAKAKQFAASTMNNMGACYLDANSPDKARPYIELALAECGDDITLAQFKATKARLLAAEGRYEEAKLVALESADFLSLMGETTFLSESLQTLGAIELQEARERVGVRTR